MHKISNFLDITEAPKYNRCMNTFLSAYRNRAELNERDYAYVVSAGCYSFDKTDFRTERPKGRGDYQLIYVKKGVLIVQNVGEFREGSVLLYRPHTPQFYLYLAVPQSEYYWIHFNGTGVGEILNTLEYGNAPFNIGETPAVPSSWREIIREIEQQKFGYVPQLTGELIRLLTSVARIRRRLEFPQLESKQEAFQAVIDLMHSSGIHTPIEDYAAMCYMSKYQFAHAFKSLIGVSPHAYQERIVLMKAQDLLLNSELSITEIAKVLGFTDIYYFSRFFKRQTDKSPSEFRKTQ